MHSTYVGAGRGLFTEAMCGFGLVAVHGHSNVATFCASEFASVRQSGRRSTLYPEPLTFLQDPSLLVTVGP